MQFFLDTDPSGALHCWRDRLTLHCILVPRVSAPQILAGKPGVYLLVDETHRAVYVGESANLAKRHSNHLDGFSWWEFAAYFFETDGRWFSNTDARKCIQQRLFDECRRLGSRIVFVSKIAGGDNSQPSGVKACLRDIIDFCRVLRLPVSQPSMFPATLAPTVELVGVISDDPLPERPYARWASARELAVALVKKHGGGVDGLVQILKAYKDKKAGKKKWRPILEAAGVKFDPKTGLVSDWSKARNPLP